MGSYDCYVLKALWTPAKGEGARGREVDREEEEGGVVVHPRKADRNWTAKVGNMRRLEHLAIKEPPRKGR